MTYYGIIEEIWELDYHAFTASLFLCKWAANDRGIKVDELGFTLVDFTRRGHKKDKFISVDQVSQVFYIQDPIDTSWSVVLKSTNRDYNEVCHEDVSPFVLKSTNRDYNEVCHEDGLGDTIYIR